MSIEGLGRDRRTRHTPVTRRRRGRAPRGQSVAEFALILPVTLFLVLFGLDFGRVFAGWISLNNAARLAANYAADNPSAWGSPGDAGARSAYIALVQNETRQLNCQLQSPVPDPTFPVGTDVGSPAQVGLTCSFGVITPVISTIVGGTVRVSASSAFPIREGMIADVPFDAVIPTPTPAPSPPSAPPSSAPPSAPLPTPTPMCAIPNFTGMQSNKAQQAWFDAGFQSSVLFKPLVPPNYRIHSQTLSPGASEPCTGTSITVTP